MVIGKIPLYAFLVMDQLMLVKHVIKRVNVLLVMEPTILMLMVVHPLFLIKGIVNQKLHALQEIIWMIFLNNVLLHVQLQDNK
jgi:hypothetical protein